MTPHADLPQLPPHRVQSQFIPGSGCAGVEWHVWLKKELYEGGPLRIGHAGKTIKEARHNARVALAAYFFRIKADSTAPLAPGSVFLPTTPDEHAEGLKEFVGGAPQPGASPRVDALIYPPTPEEEGGRTCWKWRTGGYDPVTGSYGRCGCIGDALRTLASEITDVFALQQLTAQAAAAEGLRVALNELFYAARLYRSVKTSTNRIDASSRGRGLQHAVNRLDTALEAAALATGQGQATP